jgi:malonyl-CoA/methylmalonyl-CoA synthetase
VLIHALPIYHTHGLFVASNVTLFSRAAMIFLPKLDPELMIKLMDRATVMMGVPTFYTRLLQSPNLSKDLTKHMRLFVSAPRRCSRKPTASGARAPDTPCSNATA